MRQPGRRFKLVVERHKTGLRQHALRSNKSFETKKSECGNNSPVEKHKTHAATEILKTQSRKRLTPVFKFNKHI